MSTSFAIPESQSELHRDLDDELLESMSINHNSTMTKNQVSDSFQKDAKVDADLIFVKRALLRKEPNQKWFINNKPP